jgi:hypothetical protein
MCCFHGLHRILQVSNWIYYTFQMETSIPVGSVEEPLVGRR